MKVRIQIIDETTGAVLLDHEDRACHPTQKKLVVPIEDGEYKFFGLTYQPHVMLKSKTGGY